MGLLEMSDVVKLLHGFDCAPNILLTFTVFSTQLDVSFDKTNNPLLIPGTQDCLPLWVSFIYIC